MRKQFLQKRLARLMKKKEDLKARAAASTDVNEVRSITTQVEELDEDINEVNEEIATLPDDEPQRSAIPTNAQLNGGNPIATYIQGTQTPIQRSTERPYSSTEYRQAFMGYVQKGIPISKDLAIRAGGDAGVTLTDELGAIIPVTIMDEFIKEVSKIYGQVYSKVRKLNVKGGIKFPISDLKANFNWITETTVSAEQKAGDIDSYIEFSYNIGEIRVAESLLAQIVTLDLFENEIVRIMTEAYVKAMDTVILNGTGVGQPLGILQDSRVTNVVTFTAAQFQDWKKWRENLFAKIPLSKRGLGEFLFTSATVEGYLLTMSDANNRPIFKEATELTIGESATAGSFYGRNVTLVEPDVIKDFDTASAGDVVGLYWIPTDYAINTNMAFGMKRYLDENTNKYINKGLTIVDGKMLDVSGCYVIKKA